MRRGRGERSKEEEMAMLLKASGECHRIHDLSLDSMQAAVGGYIEFVKLQNGKLLVVNEEGVLEGLPPNRLVAERYGLAIVGDVILVAPYELEEGEA
jgi:hypothetical protein